MQKNTENILEKVPEKGIMSKIAELIKYRQIKDNFIDSVGDETMEQQHMFTNRMIRNLLVPVVLEQILNSIMGTADTMMVSNVGSAALSAVSLVDSINILLIQAFRRWQQEVPLYVPSISVRKIMRKQTCLQDRCCLLSLQFR